MKKVLVKVEYEASIHDHWDIMAAKLKILETGELPPVATLKKVEVEKVNK